MRGLLTLISAIPPEIVVSVSPQVDKIILSTLNCLLSQGHTHPTSKRRTFTQALIVAHSPNLSLAHTQPTFLTGTHSPSLSQVHTHQLTKHLLSLGPQLPPPPHCVHLSPLEPQAVKPKSRSSGSLRQFVKLPFLTSRMPIKENHFSLQPAINTTTPLAPGSIGSAYTYSGPLSKGRESEHHFWGFPQVILS